MKNPQRHQSREGSQGALSQGQEQDDKARQGAGAEPATSEGTTAATQPAGGQAERKVSLEINNVKNREGKRNSSIH